MGCKEKPHGRLGDELVVGVDGRWCGLAGNGI